MTIELTGESELRLALVALGAQSLQAGRRFVLEAAHRIEAAAKRRVRVRTGACRRSIHVEGPVERAGVVEASVGPSVFYAGYLERLYPYMAPAVEEVLPDLGDLEVSLVGAELDQLGI